MSDDEHHFDASAAPVRRPTKQNKTATLHEDGYDDNLKGDEADIAYLNGLSNAERERVLASRYEKREEALRKRDLLKHSKERVAVMSKKHDEIELLKTARQRKKDQADAGENFANYDNFESADSDSDSSVDEKQVAARRSQRKLKNQSGPLGINSQGSQPLDDEEQDPNREIKDSDNKEVAGICLNRKFLVNNSSNIHFKEAVLGCLVRVTFQTGDSKEYKIGEIVDVIERPTFYKVENKEMNKYLMIRFGNEDREFKILYISSKGFEQVELNNYLKELTNNGQPRPTLRDIREKKKRIMSILGAKFSAKEIGELVEKRNNERVASSHENPKEKKRILEEKRAKLEYAHFEKPSIQNKKIIKQLNKDIKILDRLISASGVDEGPLNYVKKSDPYTFGSSKPKTGESVMHTRTIPQPLNMWSLQNDEVE